MVGVGKQVGVQLVDENGNVFKTFYSISDCAKYFGLSRTLIYSRIPKNEPVPLPCESFLGEPSFDAKNKFVRIKKIDAPITHIYICVKTYW